MANQVNCSKGCTYSSQSKKIHHKRPCCWNYCQTKVTCDGKLKHHTYLTRRCHTGYNSATFKGSGGHSSFAGVLFSQKAPMWLHEDQSLRHHKGLSHCPNRTKGHRRSKCYTFNNTVTPGSSSISKSVIPAMHSFEDVLEVRKTMAFYDPRNFKRSRRHRRHCC